MHSLQALLAFSETAKRGGFAAAARELGSSPSTLAKAVARLEASLGLRLFHRTCRQVSLTVDGERLFQHCQRVLAELEELQSEAAGARAAPSGTLRIDMPIVFGRKHVLPILAQLLAQHPGLAIDARFSDTHVDLVKDRIDVAIRIGELQDSTLISRRFASQELLLVAAPDYLRQHGTPQRLEDLASHRSLLFRMPTTGRDRPQEFSDEGRKVLRQPDQGQRFNDGQAIVQATVLGMGIAQVPDNMAAEDLTAGRLIELMPRHRPAPTPIHAVTPGNRMVPARVRVLLDALVEPPPAKLPRPGPAKLLGGRSRPSGPVSS